MSDDDKRAEMPEERRERMRQVYARLLGNEIAMRYEVAEWKADQEAARASRAGAGDLDGQGPDPPRASGETLKP